MSLIGWVLLFFLKTSLSIEFCLEFQYFVIDSLPDQGDRHSKPRGGGDGSQVPDGGVRGLICLKLNTLCYVIIFIKPKL